MKLFKACSAHPKATAPHPTPPKSHSRSFPWCPLHCRDAQLLSLLPVMELDTRYQLPQFSCAGEREDRSFGQISTQPRPCRVGREEAQRPLALAGWPQAWLACLCRQGSSLSLFLSILHFTLQGSECGAHQPRMLGLLSPCSFPILPLSFTLSHLSCGTATHAQAEASALP